MRARKLWFIAGVVGFAALTAAATGCQEMNPEQRNPPPAAEGVKDHRKPSSAKYTNAQLESMVCGDGICGYHEASCGCAEDCGRDSDGDGLADAWEIYGIDKDGDGVLELDLPAMGANPYRKDLFLEIDYMESADHSHRPRGEALDLVVRALANAPNHNPDGTTGVRVHLFVDEALAHHEVIAFSPTECGGADSVDFDAVKAEHFDHNRRYAFHYAIFGHRTRCASSNLTGEAELPGNDIIVSLGMTRDRVGTAVQQAGTLLHELGHNLGLKHAGATDGPEKQSNYLSVMNTRFQLTGIPAAGRIDFSGSALPTLDEAALDERLGLQGTSADETRYHCVIDGKGVTKQVPVRGPVDWNCNGVIDEAPVSGDLNNDGVIGVHKGHDDWGNVLMPMHCALDWAD